MTSPRERARAAAEKWAQKTGPMIYYNGDLAESIADEFAADVRLAALARKVCSWWAMKDATLHFTEAQEMMDEARRQLATAAPTAIVLPHGATLEMIRAAVQSLTHGGTVTIAPPEKPETRCSCGAYPCSEDQARHVPVTERHGRDWCHGGSRIPAGSRLPKKGGDRE